METMETCFVARDNSGVLTVKLGRETSLVAYSTDKRFKRWCSMFSKKIMQAWGLEKLLNARAERECVQQFF